ncbi:MAG: exosortase/archaeosortase family protein [Candidatus Aenigmarchaeota archaeon]|nr:exosortase/archaeosortase family protein [Candidatus Aenigmarchaeota archaeon]
MTTRKKERQRRSADFGHFWNSKDKHHRILKFLIKFNIFAIPLYVLLLLDWQSGLLQSITADITFWLLQATGIAAERTGNFIAIQLVNGQWGAFINWDCTGWKSFLALFALVMATDFSLGKKAKGLVILLPALFAVNIGRILFMFHFARGLDLAYFDIVHATVWSWGLIFAILAFWTLWMRHNTRGYGILV